MERQLKHLDIEDLVFVESWLPLDTLSAFANPPEWSNAEWTLNDLRTWDSKVSKQIKKAIRSLPIDFQLQFTNYFFINEGSVTGYLKIGLAKLACTDEKKLAQELKFFLEGLRSRTNKVSARQGRTVLFRYRNEYAHGSVSNGSISFDYRSRPWYERSIKRVAWGVSHDSAEVAADWIARKKLTTRFLALVLPKEHLAGDKYWYFVHKIHDAVQIEYDGVSIEHVEESLEKRSSNYTRLKSMSESKEVPRELYEALQGEADLFYS
jgi:hypothetical protein